MLINWLIPNFLPFISLLLFLLVIISPSLIYLDASKHNIGKGTTTGFFNMSAGAWAASTILFTILAVPSYLILRKKLIEKAKINPVYISTGKRIFRVILVSVIALLSVVFQINDTGQPAVPYNQPIAGHN